MSSAEDGKKHTKMHKTTTAGGTMKGTFVQETNGQKRHTTKDEGGGGRGHNRTTSERHERGACHTTTRRTRQYDTKNHTSFKSNSLPSHKKAHHETSA